MNALAGVLALVLLALCALLPILGHLRVEMRAECTRKVREQQNARLAAAILAFDDLDAYARGIHGRMYADGLLADRRKAPRIPTAQEGIAA